MRIAAQRIYDERQERGYRVLVDRIWPRGIRKEEAALDEWCKDLAPSTGLRKWFGHDLAKWEDFRQKYLKELQAQRKVAQDMLKRAGKGPLVLLYGAKDTQHNQAVVLQDYLERLALVS